MTEDVSREQLVGLWDFLKTEPGAAEFEPLCRELIAEGQAHLFAEWGEREHEKGKKAAFLQSLAQANRNYPGGLVAYIRRARELLREVVEGANPWEGCYPTQPETVDLSDFGEEYFRAERAGLDLLGQMGVVLVAGGLGERLGYSGIKLEIPVEVTEGTSYLGYYASVLKEAGRRVGKAVPLVIMTSRETDAKTRELLERHGWFGLAPESVTILKQELVPALADVEAHLALEAPFELSMKPHGHGDVHLLLHQSGTVRRLAGEGIRYLLFIQDTNALCFNAAWAALGASERHGFDFNSVAVPRIPGEACGALARLEREGKPPLTINVEYNQLDPLLRATVSPAGDVAGKDGWSLFPGNINVLVLRVEPYLRVLEETAGVVGEFINPKFADLSRTVFKKPARLETLMQDLPKSFRNGERVGVTVFDRRWCFSACKNSLTDAAAKVAAGGPPESASSAESDFYLTGRRKMALGGAQVTEAPVRGVKGIPIVPGPRVIVRPSTALALSECVGRFRGCRIEGASTVVVEGDVELVDVTVADGAGLVVKARPGASLRVEGLGVGGEGFRLHELDGQEEKTAPEFLRIRGYRIDRLEPLVIEAPGEGRWIVGAEGRIRRGS